MAKFNFGKVENPKVSIPQDPSFSDPLKIFYGLEKSSLSDVTDPRPLQVEALDLWKELDLKGERDIIIPLDTGAGKTLIGLLIAESIRRQTGGKVIYVCPDNHLVAQVKEKALLYGIKNISSYSSGEWINKNEFYDNDNICVTNYDAIFTHRSQFQDPPTEIKAYIFDDAHSSLDKIDTQYSVTINDEKTRAEILDIISTFEDSIIGFKEVRERSDPSALALVPPNIWEFVFGEIMEVMLASGEDKKQYWAWPKIRGYFDKCLCLISPSKIEISLLYPDTKNHPVLNKNIRRVYLSATIPNLDDIKRIYDIVPVKVELTKPDFRPQRLFLFPGLMKFPKGAPFAVSSIQGLTEKALILVPRKDDAAKYAAFPGVVSVLGPETISECVETFKDKQRGYLVLASRYDGIDFPGDVCKFLVVDGLPYVGGLKDRFFSEKFGKQYNSQLRSFVASKLVQAFGRTVRSATDYSVVLVTGADIENWVSDKDNRKYFRQELSQDIEIGRILSSAVESVEDLKDLIDSMMSQDDEWKQFLERKRSEIVTETTQKDSLPEEIDLAAAEREIYDAFLAKDYGGCLVKLTVHEEKIKKFSPMLYGLYLGIGAVCCMKSGEVGKSNDMVLEANSLNKYMGLPPISTQGSVTLQASNLLSSGVNFRTVSWVSENKNFEEDLRKLGESLGFTARRPEKESKGGTLDVSWADDEQKIAVGFACKANKTNELLDVDEVGQALSNLEWLKTEYKGYRTIQVVVGDIKRITDDCTPGEVRLWTLPSLDSFSKKVGRLYRYKLKFPKEYISNLLRSQNLTIDYFNTLPFISKLRKDK